MTPIWSADAWADLAAARACIDEADPAAAERVARRILESVETLLPANPHTGRPGRVPGTRELVVTGTPFIVPYRVVGDKIQVLRVYHGARRWPEHF